MVWATAADAFSSVKKKTLRKSAVFHNCLLNLRNMLKYWSRNYFTKQDKSVLGGLYIQTYSRWYMCTCTSIFMRFKQPLNLRANFGINWPSSQVKYTPKSVKEKILMDKNGNLFSCSKYKGNTRLKYKNRNLQVKYS